MRKRILRRLSLWIVPLVGALLIRFIYLTSRKYFHLPQVIPSESVIFACWHGDLLMQPYLYYQFRSIPKAKVLISEHFDGQVIAGIIRFFKLGTIHGSTTRGGAKVLIQGLKALSDGYDIGITPDGPKGPRYSVSDGVVIMAQKRHAKVVVFHCHPSRYWQLPSWDRFVVPKPFGVLDFYASEPIDVEGLDMEQAKGIIKENLMKYAL
ncbi:MAG: lysophospholipid acyltransferase family protein [Sulfuricurvum sp.]|nr:lysophospholipid acyltransferase family protein [Sulfuricurvum sp.]MDD5387116.1 lysophospholipid acyltransferase family protein [Sulfuricurvum sp.]